MKKIYVTKEFLFSLMHSHSRLSQAEYERNPAYNDSHFSAMAEQALVNDLSPEAVNEYFEYVDSKEKEPQPRVKVVPDWRNFSRELPVRNNK